MSFTKEQEKSIYTKNKNILVSASAGSGKTTVLTERIIQNILDKNNNINIDEMLIVTFTRAAAAEMKFRLYDLINSKLQEDTSNSHLRNQIILLDKSYITTIDSFCLSIVKKHFKIVDIDPNFRIGDTGEIDYLMQDALNSFFEELYNKEDNDFISLVKAYSNSYNDNDFSNKFLFLYKQIQNIAYPNKWINSFLKDLNTSSEEDFFNSKIFKVAIENTIKLIESSKNICFEIENILIKTLGNNFKKPKFLIEDLNLCEEFILILNNKKYNYFIETILNLNFARLDLAQLKQYPEEKEKIKFLRHNFKNNIKIINEKYFNFGLSEILNKNKTLYKLTKNLCNYILKFDKYFLKIKKDKKVFTFNDISNFCIQILIDKNTLKSTIIAKEYQEKFKEIIIDEYQDINLIQETILNSISQKNNRFMVGDLKQCIYKFRNSNPNIFLEKYEKYSQNNTDNEKINLTKNFRSNKNIIDGVNFVFEQIMSKDLGEIEYDDKSKLSFAANFKDIDNKNLNISEKCELYIIDDNNTSNSLSEDDSYINEIKNIEIEANFISNKIQELINNKSFKVYDKDTKSYRNVKYKDIVILLRNTKETSDIFLKVLNENSIPAFTNTSTGFFEFIEISTIINLLKIIDNPLQDLSLISILYSPIFCFTSEDLLEIRLFSNDRLFYNQIKKYINSEQNKNSKLNDKLILFMNKLNNWQELSSRLTVSELLTYLYEDTNYYNYLSFLPKGKVRQNNLLALLEKSIAFENTNLRGIFNFINYIEKIKKGTMEGDTNYFSEDENLVRVMSIHKSKGLEFPVVFLGMLGKTFNTTDLKGQILFHNEYGIATSFVEELPTKDFNAEEDEEILSKYEFKNFQKNVIKNKIESENLSEEIRILYVALTRAKDKLILSGICKNLKSQIEKWNTISSSKYLNKDKIFIKNNSNSFLDWIGIALQKKSDIWNIEVINKNEIKFKLNKVNNKQVINYLDFIKDIDVNKAYSKNKVNITNKLNWIYPNTLGQSLKSTSSVSEIKRIYQKEILGINEFENQNLKFNFPKFYKSNKETTSSAKIGTIYHTILEHLDFNISEIEMLDLFINRLIDKNILKEEEAKIIDKNKILNFLNSSLVKRINKSDLVKREQMFVIGLSPFEVYKSKEYLNLNSKILVSGIIDIYFEENNEIVLIDYKLIKEKKREKILKTYSVQIDIYKKAIEKSTGKKVKEVIIYLINNNSYITF